ncbi:nitrate ABC transporter substrate-binding protein [Eubacterium ramulus]|uniref:ABC transporter substrate-binding protein n=1 Tax=Eubacterium ramulus TaxID=39490 RepID=UPI00102227E7|nr:ABC transporter substrate-binding protein [Eubacterium ramulus]MBS5170938.1 ABC transporter substrate-binding protein [Lachnospiraceae bacterium]MSC77510.1 nitrate ABC transporter substrate-binding protein [Eubacterium ramulus]MSC93628.1 nitrate ABC transporter substrate-binding protein [Eubacterium ramulus]RYS98616.1 nitrate ABC transporter substrate-binding protein [Eubacterium ramulus]
MKKRMRKLISVIGVTVLAVSLFAGCGNSDQQGSSSKSDSSASAESTGEVMSNEDIIKSAAEAGTVGNWGLGNEYEIQALLTKYGEPTDYLSQDFTMDGFDDDSIKLASAMTFNELGLVKNDYDGGYDYGDTVGTIDMNDEGVAMLEDNIFCTKQFAAQNPNTVKAFLYASLKGWAYAVEHPDEAAEICYEYGSSVSADHQAYMADEVAKLVTTNTKGETVSDYGYMDPDAMQQTLDLAKQYVQLDDSAAEKLQNFILDDVRDTSFWEAVTASDGSDLGTPEKSDVSIQLKWLPDAQFMGYYVALDKGYYDEVGLNVNIVSGGGDISETTAVNNGTVDFGVTWFTNLISADAGGMNLVEVSQIFQRSGLVLVYKLDNYSK